MAIVIDSQLGNDEECQAHGPAPHPGVHALAEERDLLWRAERLDQLGRAVCEKRVHREGDVRAAQKLVDEQLHCARRTRAAEMRADADRLPACFVEAVPRLLEAGRRLHLAVFEAATFLVADRVEWTDDVLNPAIAARQRRADLVNSPAFERRLAEQ